MSNDNAAPVYYLTHYARDDVSATLAWWQFSSLEGAKWRLAGHASLGRCVDLRDTYGFVLAAHNMPAATALRLGIPEAVSQG